MLYQNCRREGTGKMKELTVKADNTELTQVLAFIDGVLEESGCPLKTQMKIDIAVEELFVNIANYSYKDQEGEAVIGIEASSEGAEISLKDWGEPFDPLSREDPDVSLSVEEREIGGLGIYMVKKSMDDVRYEYRDGQNILTIRKDY